MGQQEILFYIRKELEQIYDGFVNCAFRGPKDSKCLLMRIDYQEMNNFAAAVELKLNSLRVKLSDYYEERLLETKPSPQIKKGGVTMNPIISEDNSSDRTIFKKANATSLMQDGNINEYINKTYKGIIIENSKITSKKNYISTNGPIKATKFP